jgi:hypothetical protein
MAKTRKGLINNDRTKLIRYVLKIAFKLIDRVPVMYAKIIDITKTMKLVLGFSDNCFIKMMMNCLIPSKIGSLNIIMYWK